MACRARLIATFGIAGLLAVGVAGIAPARADHQPVIAVPGKPGVPVIINGVDATGAVVYGDWGLYRPGGTVVIDAGVMTYAPVLPRSYFPATGRQPAYGRKEIEPSPNRPRPPTAPAYQRSWSVGSQPGPITEYPPFAPPPVIVAPRPGR